MQFLENPGWQRQLGYIYYIGLGMYREWKNIAFQKEYCIWICKQQDWEVDQEIDGKIEWAIMEE
jgi:hypothetical protein